MMDDIQCKFTTTIDWSLLLQLEKLDKGSPKRRKAVFVNLGKMSGGKRTHKGKFVVTFMRDYLQLIAIARAAYDWYEGQGPVGNSRNESVSKDALLKLAGILETLKRKGHG